MYYAIVCNSYFRTESGGLFPFFHILLALPFYSKKAAPSQRGLDNGLFHLHTYIPSMGHSIHQERADSGSLNLQPVLLRITVFLAPHLSHRQGSRELVKTLPDPTKPNECNTYSKLKIG